MTIKTAAKKSGNQTKLKAQFVKACAYLADKKYDQGLAIILSLARRAPHELGVHLKLIECYINTGKMNKANITLSNMIQEHGAERAVLQIIPLVKFYSNDFDGAYKATLALTGEERSNSQIKNVIRKSICFAEFSEYSSVAELDLLELFASGDLTERHFFLLGQQLVLLKLGLSRSKTQLNLPRLCDDKLFLKLLTSGYVRLSAMEKVVRLLRHKLLTLSLSNMEVPDNLVVLAEAIGIQSLKNGYVHYVSDDEEKMLCELEKVLEDLVNTDGWSPFQAGGLFLLLCMYRRLYDLPFKDKLLALPIDAWPQYLKSVVEQSLYDISEEVSWLEKVESLDTIDNDISAKVQKQYEAHPYPRWTHMYWPKEKMSYSDYVQVQCYCLDETPYKKQGVFDVLVAGCGTGSHPLQLANIISDKITAIDISRRSLAYAQMAANRQGISSVDFYHLDLLKVSKLNQCFDVVESVGVLHHMQDPEEGLKALLDVIRPGGYLKLGLYSELSRRQLVKLRELYEESGMEPTENNIRAIRQTLLTSSPATNVFGIVNQFADFYSMSTCRDLIFHVQEHRYSIPKLKALLGKYNLKFLHFYGLKKNVFDSFVSQYGAKSLVDLDAWQKYEQANPDTFGNMYQFLTQVAD